MTIKPFADWLNEDQLPGGVGDKTKTSDLNQDELRVGIEVEREHVDGDTEKATEIATDHLTENPKFYSESISKGMVDEGPALKLAKELGWEIGSPKND